MTDKYHPFTVAEIDVALARLPVRDREIFMQHRLDGLAYEEISERNGISVKRVERIIARALTRLRREIAKGRRRRR